MRIITYPHDLAMGGSQLNAIDLSAEMQRAGHDVVVYGQPGILVDHIEAAGLEFIASPRVRMRPTPSVVAHLRHEIRRRQVDVVHGYEWPPTLEAVLAGRGTGSTAVSTVLSMSVAPFIPYHVPLLVGTEQILATEGGLGRTQVGLLEPPVDTRLNSPDVNLPLRRFEREWDLDAEAFTVVVVSRLTHEMKLEGILTAMEAVRVLHERHRVQLLVVGGGPALAEVRERAERINAAAQARAIVVTGELLDPRPAYAVADAVLGMGSSALRAMAFGKPVVVQGIDGYFEPLTQDTLATFLWQGWYGQGPGTADAVGRLDRILTQLVAEPRARDDMGRLALQTVRDRFSLTAAAERQLAFYEQALVAERGGHPAAGEWKDTAASLARFVRHLAGQTVDRWRGHQAVEDFNSRATLSSSGQRTTGGGPPTEEAPAAEVTR